MRQRINEISSLKDSYNYKSDLYTRYKFAFDRLLPLTDMRFKDTKDPLYINDKEVESQLYSVVEDINDTLSMLIGYAGIGKSTVLRYCFGFNNSSPTLYNNDEKILIFPASFNGSLPDIQANQLINNENDIISRLIKDKLSLRILSVCTFLENKFDDLKKSFYSEDGQKEFYSYICETVPGALEHVPDHERMKFHNEKEEREKRIMYAWEEEKFVCAASKLKYYLGSLDCKCEKIIIILDDIEPLSYGYQIELIMQYVRFYECMKNRSDNYSQKNFTVNIIIALRPHTYRIFKGESGFKSYYITREILKEKMVNLAELFERKVKLYENSIPHKNIEKWKKACKVLNILSNKFNSQYRHMIENISIGNTREAIEIYKRVLENRVWVQNNMEKTEGFSIMEDNYIFNNVTVLRAIACENYYVYSSNNNIIPNILKNTINKNYSIIILLILSMFNKDRIKYRYGDSYKNYRNIINDFLCVFPGYPGIEDDVSYAMEFLFLQKLLRKSINDIDEIDTINKAESLTDKSLLYLTTKGSEILDMLSSDSVYLELCREDYYRDYENKENCYKSSFELMVSEDLERIYIDLCTILLELLNEEKKYVMYAYKKKRIAEYINNFGTKAICRRLYNGVLNSMSFSSKLSENGLNKKIKKVEKEIETIENIFLNYDGRN